MRVLFLVVTSFALLLFEIGLVMIETSAFFVVYESVWFSLSKMMNDLLIQPHLVSPFFFKLQSGLLV